MDLTKALKAQLGEYAKAFDKYENRDNITFLTCEPFTSKHYVYLHVIIRVEEPGIADGYDKALRAMVVIRETGEIVFKYCRNDDYSTHRGYKYTVVPTFEELCLNVDSLYRTYINEFYQSKNAEIEKVIDQLPG